MEKPIKMVAYVLGCVLGIIIVGYALNSVRGTVVEVKSSDRYKVNELITLGTLGEYRLRYSGYLELYGSLEMGRAVAVFTDISMSNTGVQFYVHTGESFTVYHRDFKLKEIGKGYIILEELK